MDPSLSSDQGILTVASEASTLASLLERGINCTRQGYYAEGVTFFALAREHLCPDQMHFAPMLDALIQIHVNYLQAQQALQKASKRFVEVDAEQQAQLAALEKLLPAVREDMDRALQPHAIALPPESPWEKQSSRLSSTDSKITQSSLPTHSLPKDGDALPALYFTCFGHFEVRRLGQPILPCSSRNGQSILRYLVARPGHYATSDTLQTMFWPEDEPEVAQSKLHIAISAMRRSLNNGLSCEPGCGYIVCKNRVYHLNPTVVVRRDVDEFLQWYQAGQQANEEKVIFYERACNLYTGPFLVEDIYADWSFLQREHLTQKYLVMCKALTDYHLKSRSYEDAAKWATAILKENRCDEAAHRQLIQIYAAQGRRSEALRQYQLCERVLREELDVEPLTETALVLQSILTGETVPSNKAQT